MSGKLSKETIEKFVIQEAESILRRKGSKTKINGKTNLFSGGSGLDSLDLAELIVVLEKQYGADPFKTGGVSTRTISDLVSYYSKHAAAPQQANIRKNK